MKALLIAMLMLVAASLSFATFDVSKVVISNETWCCGVPLGGLGCGRPEILFPPATAPHIKIINNETENFHCWSVGEMYAYE